MDPIRLIQLTDLHLFEQAGTAVDWCDADQNLNTDKSLSMVLDQIDSIEAEFFAFVVTGDIAQEPRSLTYQRFSKFFENQSSPVFCLPGNHDNAPLMAKMLQRDPVQMVGHVLAGNWLLIFLDSSQAEEEPSGYLPESEFRRLADLLKSHLQTHAMIFIHHPPVNVGSEWLDDIGLNNREELLATISTFKNVKSVVFGHAHQEYDQFHQGIRFIGTPSTCVQFKPGQQEFAFDSLAPAYRWLELHRNGDVQTGVEYLGHL